MSGGFVDLVESLIADEQALAEAREVQRIMADCVNRLSSLCQTVSPDGRNTAGYNYLKNATDAFVEEIAQGAYDRQHRRQPSWSDPQVRRTPYTDRVEPAECTYCMAVSSGLCEMHTPRTRKAAE